MIFYKNMKKCLGNENFLKNFYQTLNKSFLKCLEIFTYDRNLYKIWKIQLFSKGCGTDWLRTSERSLGTNYLEQSQSQCCQMALMENLESPELPFLKILRFFFDNMGNVLQEKAKQVRRCALCHQWCIVQHPFSENIYYLSGHFK